MNLTCPSCGAKASLEAWNNDATWRELLAVLVSLPAPLPRTMPGYLSLFRPAKTALSPAKSLRVAKEVAALVACGYVHAPGCSPDRDCPPATWAKGMEQMIEQQAGLQRPMKNHNYLCKVVWGLADQADAAREQGHRQAELRGDHRSRQPSDPCDGLSETMRKLLARQQAENPNP